MSIIKTNILHILFTFIIVLILIFVTIQTVLGQVKYETEKGLRLIDEPNDDRLFDLKMRTYMRILNMPSATVCAMKNDTILWSKSYGHHNFYLREKTSLDTIYVIGSISKTIIGTAIMQLYENDSYNFTLDDNVSKFLDFDIKNPKYPNDNITFKMLLSHQSSLGDRIYDLINYLPLLDDPGEWVKSRVVPGEPYYYEDCWKNNRPGQETNYSNMGFILLAHIIEKMTGMSYEDYCQKHIFEPLNMTDTSFKIDKLDKNRFARPYINIVGGLYIPLPNYDIKCASACGGLRTTCIDLSHFLMAHMNKGMYNGVRILNESTINLMHSLPYPDSYKKFYQGSINYGLAWIHLNISEEVWEGYNGGAIGYSCNMMLNKDRNIGVVLLSNVHWKRGFYSNIGDKLANFRMVLFYEIGKLIVKKFH